MNKIFELMLLVDHFSTTFKSKAILWHVSKGLLEQKFQTVFQRLVMYLRKLWGPV